MSILLETPEAFMQGSEPPIKRGQVRKVRAGARYGDRPPAYYNEGYAKALLPTLIEMIKSRQDKEFMRERISTDTLYQRVHQAFAYCIDHLDEAGLLDTLRREVQIRRTPKGIVLCFMENSSRYDRQATAHSVSARPDAFKVRNAISVNWHEAVHEFVESDARELVLKDGFALTPQEQSDIRALISLVPEGVEPISIVMLNGFNIHLRRGTQ